MSEMTPETLPTMPYSEDTRTCAKACMAVLPPNDAMYLWLQIYLEHTAALQARVDALEKLRIKVRACGVSSDIRGLDYIEVQIPRRLWAALAADEKK